MGSNNSSVDFVGIGVGRSGTIWILNALAEHKGIWFPYTKELNYFSNPHGGEVSEYDKRGINGYLDLFKECPKNKIKGEFSSHYMPDPKVPKILKKHFPNVKIWAILRDPVERAFSDYVRGKEFHLKEKDSFEEAFFAEKNILYKKGDGYQERGYYYKHLKRYFELFSRENIKIILYDDFKKDNEKVIKELYEFLGVDPLFKPSIIGKRINERTGTKFRGIKKVITFLAKISHKLEEGMIGKLIYTIKRKTGINRFFNQLNELNTKKEVEKEKLDPELRDKLKVVYLDDITKLEKLIGRDLSEWK
ncbi:sulfotransferase domain-containing protein [Candidatus Pacearchaeota archaeon]|nr:sulfotransferase domain-containing protein [Candidatus Pacearchaeota archaeon]